MLERAALGSEEAGDRCLRTGRKMTLFLTDTLTASVAILTGDEQKGVKTTGPCLSSGGEVR